MNIREVLEAAARFNAAFPSTHTVGDTDTEIFHPGLSKRELFAALAMAAMRSNVDSLKMAFEMAKKSKTNICDEIAELAIAQADILLNKLEEPIK